jgi:hypothetical protein
LPPQSPQIPDDDFSTTSPIKFKNPSTIIATHRVMHPSRRMLLPETAKEFARIIGVGATLRLADCAKSSHRSKRSRSYRIRIPVNSMDEQHPIVRTIGKDNARLLQRHFAGETLAFPARRIKAIERDVRIAKAFTEGNSIPVLAVAHHVSERTVLRALGRITTKDVAEATPTPPVVGSPPAGTGRVTTGAAIKG